MFNFNRNIKTSLLTLIVALVSVPAFASGSAGYSAGGWTGSVNAGASSISSGGSQTETGAQGNNGYASAYNANAGGGTAHAGGFSTSTGVETFSGLSSFSHGESRTNGQGSYTTNAMGGNGTDVNSWSSGAFQRVGFGGFAGFSWGR